MRNKTSIESLVPRHTFADHPLTGRYVDWVETRRAEFDWDAAVQKLVDRAKSRAMNQEAVERCTYRRTQEAKRAVEILEQYDALSKTALTAGQ